MSASTADLPSPAPIPAAPVGPASTSDIVHASSLSTCVLVVLVLSWSLGGSTLARRNPYLTEGSAACALGLITGLILLLFHHILSWEIVTQLLEFNAAGFFTYLLPPVIFYCGLSVEKSRFFMALPSILTFGVFGTLASFAIISLFLYVALGFALFKIEDCLAMGAIFAATDSVATLQVLDRDTMPELFSLVFGEGVVNDAVSVVLLGAVASTAKMKEAPAAGNDAPSSAFAGRSFVLTFVYLLLTSLVLGTVAGLGIAAALKKLALHDAHQELAVITLLSYFSYLLADVTGLSGILSLFVCGVVVSHYALHNISDEGRQATMTGFKTASYLAEGIIFIYVGMDCLDPLKWQAANGAEAIWLVLILTAVLVAARAAFVIPFSLLHNLWSADKLSSREIVVIWWAGLMRGAVSVALVYLYFDDDPRQMPDKGRATLIVSTLMIVMLSILGFGALTKPLLAAMLGGDSTLMEQIKTIPLLSNLARDSSATALIEQLDSSFASNHRRHGGTQYSHLPMAGLGVHKHGHTSSTDHVGRGQYNNSSESIDNSGIHLGQHSASHNKEHKHNHSDKPESDGAAPSSSISWGHVGAGTSLQGEGLPTSSPAVEVQGGFIGFDLGAADSALSAAGEEVLAFVGEPLIADDGFTAAVQGQEGDVSPTGGVIAAVEMQVAPGTDAEADAGAAGGASVLHAMRHMGEAWGAFDRQFMQPVFGGPGESARSTPRSNTANDTSLL